MSCALLRLINNQERTERIVFLGIDNTAVLCLRESGSYRFPIMAFVKMRIVPIQQEKERANNELKDVTRQPSSSFKYAKAEKVGG